MRLQNKVAIITGVGAGIGVSIAARFAEEGARLVLNDIHEANGQNTLKEVRGMGAEAEFLAGDISDEATGKKLADLAIRTFGKLDIVVNNAADFTQKGVEEAELADWQRVISTNILGTAFVCKHAIPHLKEQGGAIVNLASMSGVIAQPHFATYNSTKGAQIMMTRCMALDLAPFNVRVNAVCPGCIHSSATRREAARMGMTYEAWCARAAPMHMLNRVGEPREVANAVLFLASDEATFITGTTLMVDGGYTAQ